MTRLIPKPPAGLRERMRADGSVRIWWEPSAAARKLGFEAVELDANRLTWSTRRAAALNAEVASAGKLGRRPAAAPGGRSIEALAETYRKSLAFTRLAAKTQVSYNRNLSLIIRKWGAKPVRDFSKPVMHTWYETLVEHTGEHQAVALVRMMSILFAHAERIGWRPEGSNPCQRLRMVTPKPRDRVASWPEITALVAAADKLGLASIGTAVLMSVLMGQRETDVMLAELADFGLVTIKRADGSAQRMVWDFTRSKRGNAAALYVHDELRPRIEATIAAALPKQTRLLADEKTGRGYDEDLFGKRWQQVRAAAIEADKDKALSGLGGLQFRDLRRTFAVLSRIGGATDADAADVLGNTAAKNPRLRKTYMPGQLETASRAIAAIKIPPAA